MAGERHGRGMLCESAFNNPPMFLYCFPEDDQDRSKHVGFITNCVYKYNVNISAVVVFVV
jgi:hypothetical protein